MAQHSPSASALSVWDALDRLTVTHLRPPTIHEVMDYVGKRSTSVTIFHLDRGVKEGRVVRKRTRRGNTYMPTWYFKMLTENVTKYYGESNGKTNSN